MRRAKDRRAKKKKQKCVHVHWPSIPNHLFHSLLLHSPWLIVCKIFARIRTMGNMSIEHKAYSYMHIVHNRHSLPHSVGRSFAGTIVENNILFDSSHSFPFIVRFRAIVCWCFPLCTSFSIVFSRSIGPTSGNGSWMYVVRVCVRADGSSSSAYNKWRMCMFIGCGEMHF